MGNVSGDRVIGPANVDAGGGTLVAACVAVRMVADDRVAAGSSGDLDAGICIVMGAVVNDLRIGDAAELDAVGGLAGNRLAGEAYLVILNRDEGRIDHV